MEIVENANTEILQDKQRYLKFLIQETNNIIRDFNLTYRGVKDTRKEYPEFTTKQFIFILKMLHERVYAPNKQLLYSDVYIYQYDIQKVELCYSVFVLYCSYYNMAFNLTGFTAITGLEKGLLIQWLNLGKSKLYMAIAENSREFDDFSMLNSENALLRLHYRNNEQVEHIQEGSGEALPDLRLPGSNTPLLSKEDINPD